MPDNYPPHMSPTDTPGLASDPHADNSATGIFIKVFSVGPLQCNCTIIGDRASGDAIVVDPGGDADLILTELRAEGLSVKRIVHTHAHFDHILAAGQLREATGAPLGLHKGDQYLWEHLEEQCKRYAVPFTPLPPPDEYLQHEQELHLPNCRCKTIHTPGHTPGSMSFWFEEQKLLVAGDTLFKGSIGRTDLWGGDYEAIERSIRQRLYTLDEEATVVTGHGPNTTLGREMRSNAYVRA